VECRVFSGSVCRVSTFFSFILKSLPKNHALREKALCARGWFNEAGQTMRYKLRKKNQMKMNSRKMTVLAFLVGALLMGCSQQGQESTQTEKTDKRLSIAVIPKGTTHTYWKSIHIGAMQAAVELDVDIIWQGPQKEDDRQQQINVVQNFVSRGVDAIVLAPLDERSLVPPVKAAVNRNIPVVLIDSGLQTDLYSSFVATNNFEGGKLCARKLAEVMNGKGKVVMLRYMEGSASTNEREAGFLEGIREAAPGIELVSTNQYAGATIEKAFQTAQNLLNRYPDVEGFFASNESATQGLLRALQTAGKAGKVKFVGFDANETLLASMRDGHLDGLALQDPVKMGYEGVKAAVAIAKGAQTERLIDTGVTMVTPANMDDEAVKAILPKNL
jgi:ribose transport system substrate-binding protein